MSLAKPQEAGQATKFVEMVVAKLSQLRYVDTAASLRSYKTEAAAYLVDMKWTATDLAGGRWEHPGKGENGLPYYYGQFAKNETEPARGTNSVTILPASTGVDIGRWRQKHGKAHHEPSPHLRCFAGRCAVVGHDDV